MNGPVKTERRAFDAYFTPDALARACVERVASVMSEPPERILEPSSGGGAFVAACHAAWPEARICAVDVAPGRREAAIAAGARDFVETDFLRVKPPVVRPPDLIIGNPPYLGAEDHIRKALEMVEPGGAVAFLLRLSMVASAGRLQPGGISRAGAEGCGLDRVYPIYPRPSFTGGGTDASEYALVMWIQGYRGPVQLGEPIRWAPPGRRGTVLPDTRAERAEARVAELEQQAAECAADKRFA